MSFLFSIKEPVLILLTLVAYAICFCQALHVMFVASLRTKKTNNGVLIRGATFYEACIVLHLILACLVANSAHSNFGRILFRLKMFSIEIEPLMWINALIFILGAVLLVRYKKTLMIPELCIFVLSTPPVISMAGSFSWFLLFIDLSFFIFRASASLVFDIQRAKSQITKLSIAETLKKLPEGFLISTNKQILIMNDAMRDELVSLGIGGSLVENVKVWNKLIEHSDRNDKEPNVCFIKIPEMASKKASKTDNSEKTLMFFREERSCNNRKATKIEQIVAVDVTEIEKLNQEIEETNQQLVNVNKRLSQELNNLEEVALEQAAFQMHKRVHNEIGQRLSILHRWLEDSHDADVSNSPNGSSISNISQKEIVELVSGIRQSLKSKQIEPEDELASLVDAFLLAGVQVFINYEGMNSARSVSSTHAVSYANSANMAHSANSANSSKMSRLAHISQTLHSPHPQFRSLFVDLLRECATNALKHGHAKNVWVTIKEDESSTTIYIQNDGEGAKTMPKFGSGLKSMEQEVKNHSGALRVCSLEPFSIEVKFKNAR